MVGKVQGISKLTPYEPIQKVEPDSFEKKPKQSPQLPALENRLDVLKELLGEKELKKLGLIECSTCASRTYQDGSNDPNVSFKAPGKVSPEASAYVVKSHEMEHVSNEKAKAEKNNRQVVSQSVRLFTSVCPECGKTYVSGGVTKTTTANKKEYKKADEDLTKGLFTDKRI